MNEVEHIRRAHYIEGKSIRGIARERRHDRRTVRKALRDAGPPRYTLRQSRPRPVLDGFTAIIDRWLAEDQEQPPKQRHTAHRIYQRLVQEHGFSGGESTVREYVRKHRPKPQPRFIPLAYDPGEDAQYDFGEGLAIVGGQPVTVQLLVARLCYSKQPFVMAFPHQRQEAFLEGHKESFHFFGGVPRNIWYDRLTQAVKRSLMGRRVQEQEAFTAFRSHYLFQSRFCNAGEAHEKGLVENLVGYARRNFLVPVPEVESFQELNALLRGRLPYRMAILQFLEVLELLREHPRERLSAALEQTLRSGSLGAETVAYFLRTGERESPAAVVSPLAEAPPGPLVQDRDLKQYDLLLQGR